MFMNLSNSFSSHQIIFLGETTSVLIVLYLVADRPILFGLSFEKRKDLTWWKAKSSNQDDADYADYAAADYVDYMYNPWIMQIMWIIRP